MKTRRITVVLTVVTIVATFQIPIKAHEKNDIMLEPIKYDETGVLPDSIYILYGNKVDNPKITINDNISTTVEKGEKGYTITPNAPLEYNTLYTFKLETGGKPITWTYQTAEKFCINGTLPSNESYAVPTDTTIEINFSHENYDISEVEKAVKIFPHIEGTWEKHKKTAVYVPNSKMTVDTEYTVTVENTIKNNNNEELVEPYSFTFYTENEEETENRAFFKFSTYSSYKEVSVNNKIEVDYIFKTNEKNNVNVNSKLYRISEEKFKNYISNTEDISDIISGVTPLTEKTSAVKFNENQYFTDEKISYGKQQKGFYIAYAEAENKKCYTVIQVTDSAAFVESDSNEYVIWLKNIVNGQPLKGFTAETSNGTKATADEDGLLRIIKDEDDKYIRIADTKNQTEAIYNIEKSNDYINKYWAVLTTDRNLYQTRDTINFWGVAKNRSDNSNTEDLTAELYSYNYYKYRPDGKLAPIAVGKIETGENSFYGSINLPDVDDGYYNLCVKHGSDVVCSTFVDVNHYDKPAYKIELNADKKAIFYGDSINVKTNTSFYDGTVMPETNIQYDNSSYGFKEENGNLKTDTRGNVEFAITPQYQGEYHPSYYPIFIHASKAEVGDMSASEYVRVFENDITINFENSFKNGISTVKMHSDKITLDRINDGSAEGYNDYIDKVDVGRELGVTLVFNEYIKEEAGTYYDNVLKKAVTRYRYTQKRNEINQINLITDGDGNAEYSFSPDTEKEGYYQIEITAKDDRGKEYRNNVCICTLDKQEPDIQGYQLNLNKEKYDIGDKVETQTTYNGEIFKGMVLYLKEVNGICDVDISNDGKYRTTFNSLPGAYIKGIIFEENIGFREIGMKYLPYDTENSKLNFDISTDKKKYEPGDECTINVVVSDNNGARVKADVNFSVVDEAQLALRDNKSDILDELFSYVSSGCDTVYSTFKFDDIYSEINGAAGKSNSGGGVTFDAASEPTKSIKGETRNDFKDTAYYDTISTDENGKCEIKFKLPDSVTSWRLTVNGISGDMKAGTTEKNIKVTMPVFASCNMADTYLVGDKPNIGVTVYGGELDGNENIRIEAECKGKITIQKGKAFERIELPLGEFDKAENGIVKITAYVDDEYADGMEMRYTVEDTYNRTPQAVYYNSPYDEIKSGKDGNTKIIFTDKNRSALISDICHMYRMYGTRLDQVVARYTAQQLLKEYTDINTKVDIPNYREYQNNDGGMKLIKYGESDLDITVKLTPYVKDYIDREHLKEYLYNNNNAKSMYALAVLREPVLNKINEYATAENLSETEYLYLALAYCKLGEADTANDIFDKHIKDLIVCSGNEAYVRTGNDNADILEATSTAAEVALYTGNMDAEKFYNYSIRHYDSEAVINLEKVTYISTAIKQLPYESGSVKYSVFGHEYENQFEFGKICKIDVPSQSIREFKVLNASDSVNMVSIANEKLLISEMHDEDVVLTRSYKVNGELKNEFKQGDIVEVIITANFGKLAPKEAYTVTDYLPSGLTPLNISGYTNQSINGHLYNRGEKTYSEFKYYARVAVTGEFTADNAIMQKSGTGDIIAATEKTTITIK